MRRGARLACAALVSLGLAGGAGCARGHRATRRVAPFALDDITLARGFARFDDGVLRVVLARDEAIGCARVEGPSVSFFVPAGPRGDHFVGSRIGVRIEARGLGDRASFGLDAEEVELRLSRVDARVGGHVRGQLAARERYRRTPRASSRGAGRFDVIVCATDSAHAAAEEPAKVAPRTVTAHVATLPDGGRALTKLRVPLSASADAEGPVLTIEHPGGASDGRIRLGSAAPARVRLPDGSLGWDAWVRFDALDLAPGGRVAGALDLRAGGRHVQGAFEARIEPDGPPRVDPR